MSAPNSHIDEAHGLTGDGIVELFEIQLPAGGSLYVKAENEATWQGNTYEALPVQLTGDSQHTDGQASRPELFIGNPGQIFSAPLSQGVIEGAIVIRRRVLKQHLDGNNNIYDLMMWKVSRVSELTRDYFKLELRHASDGPYLVIPGRRFLPPAFPTVRL